MYLHYCSIKTLSLKVWGSNLDNGILAQMINNFSKFWPNNNNNNNAEMVKVLQYVIYHNYFNTKNGDIHVLYGLRCHS